MNILVLLASLAVSCPEIVEVKPEIQPVQGWVAHDPHIPHRFYFAQFSDGAPERQAYLMPDKESWSGKDKVLHFFFQREQEPWLLCSYTGTDAILARKLPTATRACRLTLDHAHNLATVSAIRCE